MLRERIAKLPTSAEVSRAADVAATSALADNRQQIEKVVATLEGRLLASGALPMDDPGV